MKKLLQYNWRESKRVYINWKSEWMKEHYWDLDLGCCTWDNVGVWIPYITYKKVENFS